MVPGAIILVDSKGFLPDQIRLHMAILARRTGRKPVRWNHTETVVSYRGNLVSMGARVKGAEMTPLIEYLKAHPKHMILEPVTPLNHAEIALLEAYAEEVCFKRKRRYQNAMFLAWIAKLKLGVNWGEKGDKRVYCYELVAHCCDLLKRWDLPINKRLISIYDIIENKHFINRIN